ncbi:hypothetical protein Y032_0502g2614 [Ancylostoma ceylanicum]|uniref:Uncharacterized protein n=1 Tax=Ancylostoma ceylanicum TaxID=53326 RepID=A0A016WU55_9BILA|nr:hypothetical protein Y032_0502g2614 [Ancylostoma ceylanicum]
MFRECYSVPMSGSSLIRALDNHDRVETERLLLSQPVSRWINFIFAFTSFTLLSNTICPFIAWRLMGYAVEKRRECKETEVSMRDSEDRVALHYAAETMDLEMFQKILEQDPSLLDCEDKNGHTPLLMAVMGGRTDLVELLLSRGANIAHCDRDGHSAVHWAVVCGQLETLTYLLSQGADVEAPDILKAAPLHYATASEEIAPELALSILHTLLKHGAKPNCRDIDERTPILWAASNGNLEAMHSLKQAGGDLMAVDRDRLGVIHCAASHGYHETIDFIMESVPRFSVDQKDRAGHTALFYAVTYGHYEVAKRLLDYGANPNHQDHRLRTPSHCAAAKGQMRMLKLLKQYNASFEIQNYRGDLPVHEAVQTGSKDVVEWLLALQPSSINAASHEGRTCLHLAAAQGNLEMVILLCTKGCFVNPLMLYKGNLYTPLDVARRKDHQVVVDYLSTKHEAKCAEEIPEEEREKNRMSFEEQLVQAKLARGRHLHDEDEENEAMMKKSKAKRRRSSETLEHRQDVTSTGVNTSERRVSSAGSPGATLPKSTSTSDLINAAKMKSKADERIEQIIREEIQKVAMTKLEMSKKASNGDNENKAKTSTDHSSERSNGKDGHDIYDYPDIDDEFEDLPAISDTSDEDYDDDGDQNRQSGSEDDDDEEKRKENLSHSQSSILKRNQSKERSNKMDGKRAGARVISSKTKRSTNDSGKLVRIRGDRRDRRPDDANHHHTLIRVHRMSEGGENAGDFEVFEDDWEEIGANRATGKDASRRYIHEKAIFQELTHLKRMQIQYGKVQERILVRSLVGNFCKMHGLDPARFKFQTFYSWEKFLYDQLKLIYMEERQRLAQARAAPATRATTIDRFETRIRQARAIPLVNESVERMSRVYGSSTMTNGRSPVRRKTEKPATGEGGKRCDCLGKHLLIKQKS